MMTTQKIHSRVKTTQDTRTYTSPSNSSDRQLARIMHSMVIRMAAWTEGEEVRYGHSSADRTQPIFSLLHDTLTNNSSGSIDDVPRGLRWEFSTWEQEQLGCEGFSERPVLQLCAILVTTVSSVHSHLLPLHQLHQLLCLAGRIQGPWLVPVKGGKFLNIRVTNT